MLTSCPLHIVPPESSMGEGECLLRQRLIVWLQMTSGKNATELRRVVKSTLHSCRASALTRRNDFVNFYIVVAIIAD